REWGSIISYGISKIGVALKALIPLALEAALALGVILFARGDFSNPISDSIGKMATGINNAIKSINGSLDDLANRFNNVGKSAKDMVNSLPSKGVELNIGYALGMGGKSFKSDDLIDKANTNDLPWFLQSGQSGAEKAKAESLKKEAEFYGLNGLFTGQEKYIKLSQTQLLNNVKDIQKNKDGLNKFLKETGLTAGTDFSTNVKKAANQVRDLDNQIFKLGQKRSKLGLLNTSDAKAQMSEIDKQLMKLEKQRGVAAKEIVNIDVQIKEVGTLDPKTGQLASGWLKDTMDVIRENKELPLDVRMKLIADLKPMEDAIKLASQKIAKLPVDPLKEIYTQTINALRDFEVAYEKFQSNLTIKTANQQESLYSSGLNAGNINREASLISLREQEARKVGIEAGLKIRQRTLNNLNSITNFGKTDEQKKELDDLRKAIKDDNENIAKMGADIAKAKRDIRQALIDQTKQVADYYRTAVREAQAVSLEFQKAQKTLENSRMQNKLREALIGAGDNIYTQFIEGIINIISQTTEIQKQQLEARKQQIDYENNIQDIKLQASELQRSLPGKIIPIDSSLTDEFNLSLKNINTTVNTINTSIGKVADSLSNEVVDAAKKANSELDKLNQTVKTIDKNSKSWIESFSSNFTDLFKVFENGFSNLGNAITNVQIKTSNWIEGFRNNFTDLFKAFENGFSNAIIITNAQIKTSNWIESFRSNFTNLFKAFENGFSNAITNVRIKTSNWIEGFRNNFTDSFKVFENGFSNLGNAITNVQIKTSNWIESFSSDFADLFNVFENGFNKLGNAITNAQIKTSNWIASMATGQRAINNLAGSLQSLVSGEAGKQLEQGAKQFISNPIGAISNFLGVDKNKILSPIQGTTVEDLLRY
ncbi:MAG: hypothetical protein ACKPJ9_05695, partial [Dolichospermum sp.]